MPIEVVEFEDDHLEVSAALVAARYGAEMQQEPLLSHKYQHAATTLPSLQNLRGRGPGVAALENGRLIGFILSMVSMFNGVYTAWVPDSGHGTDTQHSRNVYRDMYAHLASRWVASGCFTLVVSVTAHHRQAIDAWHSLGFGMTNVDALRDLSSLSEPRDGIDIRRAGSNDVDAVMSLEKDLNRHLASSPTFLPSLPNPATRRSVEERLSNSENLTWIACRTGASVGCLSAETSSDGSTLARSDDGILGLVRAYVEPDARSLGVGTALVNAALGWGRSAGHKVCAVHFESANIQATRFWLGAGFRPVVYSLTRRLDDRIAWATE
ncbi:MAG: GNAT family N-acetyltransferase [Chloroflexi bacterium]|nr:GNAT family N-acetyltransferase [Chloroflexota bacterium]